jgi:D-alanine-D-alanine ligase-like ATP-grasp enzyme
MVLSVRAARSKERPNLRASPNVGSDVLGSAVAMDKDIAERLMRGAIAFDAPAKSDILARRPQSHSRDRVPG